MFKSVFKIYAGIAGMLILSISQPAQGQEQAQDIDRLQHQSVEKFQVGDYEGALEGFRLLRDINPANPLYAYYAGICMVKLNRDVEEAIELLYGAALRDVPANVHYYLGLAYQRIYEFRKAQEYFRKFELTATRQELKQYDIDKLIADCRSAREITSRYNPYEVTNVTFLDLYDSVQFSQIRMKGGQLGRKPKAFFSEGEDRKGLTSLMFVPVNPVRGEYAYFAGYHRSGRGGSQLYRVRMGPGRSWGDPEEIRDLNTDGDELLPYFDPIERDLYFASDGREGIGGYDLYRSHYDQDRDEWSEPINLGFPINSAMDEYLLLPGTDLGMVMFFSNRQATDTSIAVYRVHVSEPKREADPDDAAMLREIASLGGLAEEVLADLESVSRDRQTGPESEATTRTGTGLRSGTGASEYQVILAMALKHQSASDSIKDLATEARMRVRESDDPNDRWVWQKQIMVWEKKAREEEEEADLLYAQLGSAANGRSMQTADAGSRPGNRGIPGVTRVDTVMGDIAVYRYDDAVLAPGGEPMPVINRFDILDRTPYSISNPIPMDVDIPEGAFYRIQLGVFSSPVQPDAFRGISPVTGDTVGDSGMIKYYAGKFSRYEDASLSLNALRSAGYEDAFIVAWYNGVKVTTQRAKQLEQ